MDFTATCHKIAKEIGLNEPDAVLSRACDDDLLPSIACYLHIWRELAPFLGLSEVDVSDVERDYGSEAERRVGILRKWKAGNGRRATYEDLVKGLLSVGRVDYAENVCSLLLHAGKLLCMR